MNRNFKVVFSKARGALMVVNEATSSVQAKGTKTVIAAAVAALSLGAGVASAADSQTFDNVQLNANTTLTITKGESDLIYTPTGTVTGTVGSETDQTFAAKGDSLNSTQGQEADVILNGGDFAVDASGASEAMEVTVGQLGIQKATQEGEKDVGTGAGNITLTANSVAAKETPVALTLNASSIDLQAGTIAFKAISFLAPLNPRNNSVQLQKRPQPLIATLLWMLVSKLRSPLLMLTSTTTPVPLPMPVV